MTVATTVGLGQPVVLLPALRHHGEQLVAVDHMALLVDDHDAVGVAVERDADVGAHLAHLRGRAPSGAVEPHSLLMLKPSGSTPSENTSAPSSHSAAGATR